MPTEEDHTELRFMQYKSCVAMDVRTAVIVTMCFSQKVKCICVRVYSHKCWSPRERKLAITLNLTLSLNLNQATVSPKKPC